MEQKDYKLEIIDELLKKDNHIRGIAKNLNTNHMSILRRIKELSEENVVDYDKRGRNKDYFLKKTIETKNYLFTLENYKLNKIIKKYPILRGLIEKIQRDKRIKLVILFGSYAKERAKQDSDIDIYIETEKGDIKKELEIINSKLSIKIGKFNKKSLLMKEIIKEHVIIKGVERYYENIEFFE